MKFIIEPSAASGLIRLPLKKEMKVPSLWGATGVTAPTLFPASTPSG